MTNINIVENSYGKSLEDILGTLQREMEMKRDIVLHPSELKMGDDGLIYQKGLTLGNQPRLGHQLTGWAESQFATKLGIPTRYFRKCPPELQAINANSWLDIANRDEEYEYTDVDGKKYSFKNWMLRLHDAKNGGGMLRGILSESYSPFDDHEFMEILVELFKSAGDGLKKEWFYRDDKGLHLRVTFPDLTKQIGVLDNGKPDLHRLGLHIENSEVGAKSIKITPLIYRLVCTNGMMGWRTNDDLGAFNQRHIHLNHNEMFNRVANAIGNGIKAGDKAIEKLVAAKETPVENPLDIIKKLAEGKKYTKDFTEKVQGAYMQEQGNGSAFYVVQAFTLASQQLKVDDRVGIENDASSFLDKLIKAV